MKDINVYCLRFFVTGAPGGCEECTLAGRVWGLLAVGGLLADRAVRVKEKAMLDRGQARDGAAALSFSERSTRDAGEFATALEIGERQ